MSKYLITALSALLPCFFLSAEEQLPISDNPATTTSLTDKTYHYLNNTFSQPARWFDQFFEDDRINEEVHSKTKVSWYNDISWHEQGGFTFESRLNARVYLPKVTHKLKLIFEPDDDDPFLLAEADQQKEESNELGLRYQISEKKRSSFNIKVTLRPGIEGRYRYRYPINAHISAHFIEKIYQKAKLTGQSSRLDIDYTIPPNLLLRLSNWEKWETDINDFKSGTSLTLYQQISQKKAINYSIGMSGLHAPYYHISNSYISLTYRQNILKKWLFYEIKPKINWNKTPQTTRQRDAGITLRLEILFTGV